MDKSDLCQRVGNGDGLMGAARSLTFFNENIYLGFRFAESRKIVHISTSNSKTKIIYLQKTEVFRRHHTMNDPVNLIDPRGTDADTYTTFPIHEVIRITDPNSPTGHTFFEFYPRDGAGLFTPVPGAAQHGSTYPDLLFPIGHYPLTPDQDQAMLRRGYDLENRANQGDYPYSLTGSGGGHNCVGFVNDVCGGACK